MRPSSSNKGNKGLINAVGDKDGGLGDGDHSDHSDVTDEESARANVWVGHVQENLDSQNQPLIHSISQKTLTVERGDPYVFSYCTTTEGYAAQINRKDPHQAIGYIRTRVKGHNIVTKAIVDSGNFYDDLISEGLAQKMKLTLYGKTSSVGTVLQTGKVQILGKVKPFQLYLEGTDTPVVVCPRVVSELAHPLNLGEWFLPRNQVTIKFRTDKAMFAMAGQQTQLDSVDSSVTQPSFDLRIQRLFDRYPALTTRHQLSQNQFVTL